MLHVKSKFRTVAIADIEAKELIDLWTWCNVYPVSHFSVSTEICEVIKKSSTIDRTVRRNEVPKKKI